MRIEVVVRQIAREELPRNDEAMTLDVVWYDGYYRPLNNRHLHAHKETQQRVAQTQWRRAKYEVEVRVWPLSPFLRLHGRPVLDKFVEASSTADNGCSFSPARRGEAPRRNF